MQVPEFVICIMSLNTNLYDERSSRLLHPNFYFSYFGIFMQFETGQKKKDLI